MGIRPGQAKGPYVGLDGSGGGPGTDKLVAIDAADTTPDYLNPKLVVTGGLTKTILNVAGNEQLQISGAGIAGNRPSAFFQPGDFCASSGAPVFSKGAPFPPGPAIGSINPKSCDVWTMGDNTSITTRFAAGSNFDNTKPMKICIYFLPFSGVTGNYDFQARIYMLDDQQTQNGNPGAFTKIIHANTGFNFNKTGPTVIPPTLQGGAVSATAFWWLEILKYHESGDTADSAIITGAMVEYGVS